MAERLGDVSKYAVAAIDVRASSRDYATMISIVPYLVAIFYYLSFAFVVGLLTVVAFAPRRTNASARQTGHSVRLAFSALSFALLVWQLSLFLEARSVSPARQIWLGRVNFAAVAVAVYFVWSFVHAVARSSHDVPDHRAANVSTGSRWHAVRATQTAITTFVTLATPLVDQAESVVGEHPVTTFGPLFPIYLLHVTGYLVAAIASSCRARGKITLSSVHGQLTLISSGIVITALISLTTNAILPYTFNDFRFCDVGTLSTVLFMLSICYAVFCHGLFETQLALRTTLVYGLLLSIVLGAYSSAVFVTAQFLTSGVRADSATQFIVLFLAFSFDPLRRFLVRKIDQLIFGNESQMFRSRSTHRPPH